MVDVVRGAGEIGNLKTAIGQGFSIPQKGGMTADQRRFQRRVRRIQDSRHGAKNPAQALADQQRV